ncbi:hypothetical protein [Granulicella sibirica]|uniref:Lipoprotein n=1 Tax=Granulicella sibirica TaxID=2479048 RepID=A0A4Q0SXI5_9BACT|nr:hypothetical protein [Granulicella sibirica]RXH54328.1 hypothetical protein GRAN_4624 [Granulicella sibirica]
MKHSAWVLGGILLLLGGCRKADNLQVTLSPGYTGKVDISCASTSSTVANITVDPQGRAIDAVCPRHPAELIVLRDAKRIELDGPPDWLATGDGIPVAIRFSLH